MYIAKIPRTFLRWIPTIINHLIYMVFFIASFSAILTKVAKLETGSSKRSREPGKGATS